MASRYRLSQQLPPLLFGRILLLLWGEMAAWSQYLGAIWYEWISYCPIAL